MSKKVTRKREEIVLIDGYTGDVPKIRSPNISEIEQKKDENGD